MNTIEKENKMGVMPIGRLLFQMSLPMIISMLIQALYNIVDSMYVSQISENALTAVSLVFPIQNLMISIAAGTGVGINALLSKSLGEKEFGKANDVARHGVVLALASSVIFAVAMFFFANPFMAMQTANADPEIFNYGVQYMQICCTLCIGVFTQITMERLLTSTGKTFYTMISQSVGAVINIILDPILIFGYFGLPKMGVAGAAAATVLGQVIGAVLALIFNLKFNKEINISLLKFRPKRAIIGGIYKIGVPSIIMQCIGSVMTFGMNLILMEFSSTAAAVFGVYFKLNSIIFMPIFGLNNGMVPIVAYNYGARHKKRIKKTVQLSVLTACCLMLIGIFCFWLIPDKLLGIFNASADMIAIGVPALRTISLSFIFAGYCIIIGSVLQALGDAVYSMINSLARQMFVLLPAAYILARLFGLSAVWWAIPIAEIVSVTLTTIFYRKVYRRKVHPLPD